MKSQKEERLVEKLWYRRHYHVEIVKGICYEFVQVNENEIDYLIKLFDEIGLKGGTAIITAESEEDFARTVQKDWLVIPNKNGEDEFEVEEIVEKMFELARHSRWILEITKYKELSKKLGNYDLFKKKYSFYSQEDQTKDETEIENELIAKYAYYKMMLDLNIELEPLSISAVPSKNGKWKLVQKGIVAVFDLDAKVAMQEVKELGLAHNNMYIFQARWKLDNVFQIEESNPKSKLDLIEPVEYGVFMGKPAVRVFVVPLKK